MIKYILDGAFTVIDGFTGEAMSLSKVSCTVDGVKHTPVWKEGGSYVFYNLPEGEHELVFSGYYYQDEKVKLVAGSKIEDIVTMKPGENYPFGGRVTWANITVTKKGKPLENSLVYVAQAHSAFEIKIAQEAVDVGDNESRLFYKGAVLSAVSKGREFLLVDGKNSEICKITHLYTEGGRFEWPFEKKHKRGKAIYPVQHYQTDEQGVIRAVFREPVDLELFSKEMGATLTAKLTDGVNDINFEI